jgi:hypothetical protein
MEVDAGWLAVRQVVSEVDPQALALVDPEHERLDGVALKTERDGGVRAVGPGCLVLLFFVPDAREIVLQDVHPAARVVIEKTVQRYLNVDGDDVVGAHAGRRRAPRAGAYGFTPLVAGERDAFRFLVARGLSTSRRVGGALGWRERRDNEREGDAGGKPPHHPRAI